MGLQYIKYVAIFEVPIRHHAFVHDTVITATGLYLHFISICYVALYIVLLPLANRGTN